MTQIHPTAVVHPEAELGESVEIGPFSIVASDVIIGDRCKIHSHVMIDSGTRLGSRVEIFTGAVLGSPPQDLKYANEKTYLEVGDDTRIREYATLNRGTTYSYKTVVGKNCFLMAYSHIAHDCVIGNHVIISNAVNMAGHVVIEDHVGVGGLSGIHQFVKIGQHSFIGGGYRVAKDVPPFVLAMGEPLQYGGVNRIGMLRSGYSEDIINILKKAYRILYRSNLLQKDALKKIREEFPGIPEIESLVQFVESSERGIIRG